MALDGHAQLLTAESKRTEQNQKGIIQTNFISRKGIKHPASNCFATLKGIIESYRNQTSSSWPEVYFPALRPPDSFSSETSGSPNCTLVANFSKPDAGLSTAIARFTEPGYPKSGAEMTRRPLYATCQSTLSLRRVYHTHNEMKPKTTPANADGLQEE
jgi:hypothetical protein